MASQAVKARLERIGQGVLSPQAGLEALAAVLRGNSGAGNTPAVVCVNPFDWGRYLSAPEPGRPVPEMYRHVQEEAAEEAAVVLQGATRSSAPVQSAVASSASSPAVASSAPVVTRVSIQREVEAALVEVLGSSLDPDQPLMSGEGNGMIPDLCFCFPRYNLYYTSRLFGTANMPHDVCLSGSA
jgi:hypothetical protein